MKWQTRASGFALPTVVIATVVMLMILVAAVGATSSARTALDAQYSQEMQRDAAESGLARAQECLRVNGYSPVWNNNSDTTKRQLTPATDCFGNPLNGNSLYLVDTPTMKTSYVVPKATTDASGKVVAAVTGSVFLFRASGTQAKKMDYSINSVVRYVDQPQLGSGAGWKTSGHIGYMLSTNGNLYGWGDNSGHQLSDSASTMITTPIKIPPPSGTSRIAKVWGSGQGASIICVLASDNEIYCRGQPGAGENGLMPSSPGWQKFNIPAGLTAVDMAVNGYGEDNACVLASDSSVYCAGINVYGTLGYGDDTFVTVPISSPTKFILPGGIAATKVYIQDWLTCAIGSDGNAYCAGKNAYGQLGQGNTTSNANGFRSTPVKVGMAAGLSVADIKTSYHAGSGAAYYRTATGRVFMDGSALYGTANDSTFNSANLYTTPREITSGAFNRMISVGEEGNSRNALCVTAQTPVSPNSGIWCMGDSKFGQVGVSGCTDASTWAAGQLNLGGEQISTSMNDAVGYQMNSVMVITTAGNVWAWGDNTYGKLGTGAPLGGCNPTPAKVKLPAGVTAVALANQDEYTAFVLGSDGNVYAMGRNNNGQLGNGTTVDSNVPVIVGIPRESLTY